MNINNNIFNNNSFYFSTPSYTSSSDNSSIVISESNVIFHILPSTINVSVKGNQNQIILDEDLPNLVVLGHNNKIYSNTNANEYYHIDNLSVNGHMNTIEYLEMSNVTISGHKNTLRNVSYMQLQDFGQNNTILQSGSINQNNHRTYNTQQQFASSNNQSSTSSNYSFTNNSNDPYQFFNSNNFQGMPNSRTTGPELNNFLTNISQFVNNLCSNAPQANVNPNMSSNTRNTFYFNFSNSEAQPQPNRNNSYGHNNFHNNAEEEEDNEEEREIERLRAIKAIINSHESYKYNERDEEVTCMICLDKLRNRDHVKSLNCCHTFHKGCIDNWLYVKLKCPLCQGSIK